MTTYSETTTFLQALDSIQNTSDELELLKTAFRWQLNVTVYEKNEQGEVIDPNAREETDLFLANNVNWSDVSDEAGQFALKMRIIFGFVTAVGIAVVALGLIVLISAASVGTVVAAVGVTTVLTGGFGLFNYRPDEAITSDIIESTPPSQAHALAIT